MFNSNDNSNLWAMILLFMLAGNTNIPFKFPTTEEINKIFQNGIEKFLEDKKEDLTKAEYGDPIWQLNELLEASKNNCNTEVNAKILSVAMSIMNNIDPNKVNCACC